MSSLSERIPREGFRGFGNYEMDSREGVVGKHDDVSAFTAVSLVMLQGLMRVPLKVDRKIDRQNHGVSGNVTR